MDDQSQGIASSGSIYHRLEIMCLEVDNIIRQDAFQYVEKHLQTVGVNVKQFCSDFVQEVLPLSFLDTVGGAACDFSVEQNTDEADMDGVHFDKESCNAGPLLHSCVEEPTNVAQLDLSLEQNLNAGIEENLTKEKQLQFEMSNGDIPDEKDPSLPVSRPTSNVLPETNTCAKLTIPTGLSTSDPVNLVDSCERESLDVELTSWDASAESIRKSFNSIDDVTNMGSSQDMKLDESCIIIDRGELSAVFHEAGRHRSYKKKLKEIFRAKKRAAKQDHNQDAAWCGNPELGSCQQKEEGSASPTLATSNHEFYESDWEII